MKKFKLFLDPFDSREKWLNKIAQSGFRLRSVDLLSTIYDFQKTDENYYYKVQYIGYMSNKERLNYQQFLDEMGYRYFNLQLNLGQFSFGRVKIRPYAKGTGMIATSPGMINKEILIIESKKGETDFELFTSRESELENLRLKRRSFIYILALVIGAAFWIFGPFKPEILTNIKQIMWIVVLSLLGIYSIYFIYILSKKISNLK
ncbi:MAG: DUF2812 domain-containing protein [Tissierellia bacterium]|nr:DUF2812 domain-containing protein [Tissierellia bacterium]